MSITRVTASAPTTRAPTVGNRSTRGAAAWTPPSEWLSLPDIRGLQRMVGLYAVFPNGNLLALSAAGNYTVDWGDGTVENFNSGVVAYHAYNYADIASTGESALGYRQVIVQVYPQSGANLTNINLQNRHNQSGLQTTYRSAWLDIAISAASMTTASIGGTTLSLGMVKRIAILAHALTDCSNLFRNCEQLVNVPLFNTGSVTTMASMFNGCYSIQAVPLFDTGSVTTMASMFNNCYSLRSVPLFNTANVTAMNSMFNNCYSLQSVPLFNTSKATNMAGMFTSCQSLQGVPLFDMSACTRTDGMFNFCYSLSTVPQFNMATVTNVSTMFNGCTALQSLPALNLSAVTSGQFSLAFTTCPSLGSVAVTGINQTVSFASAKLSAAALNTIFTNLSSTGTGKTITVTGNYGAATCDTSIATAKGWTVTT